MLYEAGMDGKIVVLAVLQNEDGTVFQQAAAQNAGRQLAQLRQGIRRIGKHKVETLTAALYIAQRVHAQQTGGRIVQTLHYATDEGEVTRVFFDGNNTFPATRKKLQRNAPRARKEVDDGQPLKINIGPKNIKDVFFGKIGRGTCLEVGRNIKMPTPVFSCNCSHL